MASRATERTPSLIALDLMRGLAAFGVFMSHLRGASFVEFGSLPHDQQTFIVAALFALTRIGQEAVLVFFVLSGLLVGGQIIGRLHARQFYLSEYVIDRGTRILLPLVPACVATAVLNRFVFNQPVPVFDVIGNMIGLNGLLVGTLDHNAPLWSLAYEIWFYVLGGLIGYTIAFKHEVSITPVFTIISILIIVFSVLTPRFLTYWLLGALCFWSTHSNYLVGLIGFVIVIIGVGLNQLAFLSASSPHIVLVPAEVAQSLIVLGVCLMLPLLSSKRLNRHLTAIRRPAALVAVFSYSLYLIHYPIISILEIIFPRANSITPITIELFVARGVLCLGIAIAFYYLFERHTDTIRRYLKSLFVVHGFPSSRFPKSQNLD